MKYYILIIAVFLSIGNANAQKKQKSKKNTPTLQSTSNNLGAKTVTDSIKKEENKQHLIHINKIMNSTVESDILAGITYFKNKDLKTQPDWIPQYYQAYGYLKLSNLSGKNEMRPTYLASANKLISANSKDNPEKAEVAKLNVLKALEKFKIADNTNPLLPNWGAEEATFLLENIGR
jgi:pyruvate dehydrogenase complex dehydrogenase (E1) component